MKLSRNSFSAQQKSRCIQHLQQGRLSPLETINYLIQCFIHPPECQTIIFSMSKTLARSETTVNGWYSAFRYHKNILTIQATVSKWSYCRNTPLKTEGQSSVQKCYPSFLRKYKQFLHCPRHTFLHFFASLNHKVPYRP